MRKLVVILLVIATVCCGCGDKDDSTLFVEKTIPIITDTIKSKDADKLASMFDGLDDTSEIERFMSECGDIENIYIDYGGFSQSKGEKDGHKYENVRTLSGLIVTTDEPLKFIVDYTQYDKDEIRINHLWIITGRTEAVENTDWSKKYHFDDDEKFVYADYYDSDFNGECRLIWGEIVEWDEDSYTLDSFDSDDLNKLDIEGIKEKYGKFGGEYDTGNGYHILFYKSPEIGVYTAVFLNDDDVADDVQKTDSIGYGVTGIREVS